MGATTSCQLGSAEGAKTQLALGLPGRLHTRPPALWEYGPTLFDGLFSERERVWIPCMHVSFSQARAEKARQEWVVEEPLMTCGLITREEDVILHC